MEVHIKLSATEALAAADNGTLAALLAGFANTENRVQAAASAPVEAFEKAAQGNADIDSAKAAAKAEDAAKAKAKAEDAARRKAEKKAAADAALAALAEAEAEDDTQEAEAEEEDSATGSEPTLEDVRAVLGRLMKTGKKPEVQALLSSFGAASLTAVDKAQYRALLAKAAKL